MPLFIGSAIAWLIGILAYEPLRDWDVSWWPIAVFSLSLWSYARYRLYRYRLARWCLLPIVTLVSLYWSDIRWPEPSPNDISHYAPLASVTIEAIAAEEPQLGEHHDVLRTTVVRLRSPIAAPVGGSIRLHLPKGEVIPEPGDRLLLSGRLTLPRAAKSPGEFDFQRFLARQGVYSTLHVKKLDIQGEAEGFLWSRQISHWRKNLMKPLEVGLSTERAALLGSLVFGAKAVAIPSEWQERFQLLGLSHLLAASGLQIAILLGVCVGIAKFLNVGRWLWLPLTILLLVLYASLTGWPPSIQRASVMGLLVLLAIAWQRRINPLSALGTAALGVLLIWPQTLFDIGFQFSVIATWAILHTLPIMLKRFPRWPVWLSAPLLLPFAVELWILPLQVAHFHQLSTLSILSNIVAGVFVDFLTVAGLIAALVGLLIPPLSPLICWPLDLLLGWMLAGVSSLAAWSGNRWAIAPPTPFSLLMIYLCIAAITDHLKRPDPRKMTVFFLSLNALLWVAFFVPSEGGKVAFLDVGQGDSAVVRTQTGKTLIIDAGPRDWERGYDAGDRQIVPYLKQAGINRIDALLITHPHNDHLGGAFTLLERYPVGHVIDARFTQGGSDYQRFLAEILRREIPYQTVQAGDRVQFDPETELTILSPEAPYLTGTNSDLNNNSISAHLQMKSQSVLFAADLEEEGEYRLLKGDRPLSAQILKVPHHGSRTSSTWEFLTRVRPQIAVVSVGEHNNFGHPDEQTLGRLQAIGAQVYRTDEDGAAIFTY